MTIPRTTVAPSRPTDPRLRRLAAMGVRWAEEPDPTGTAPGGDGEDSKEPKKGTHEDAAEYVKNGGDKGKAEKAGGEGEKTPTVPKSEYEALKQEFDALKSKSETADQKAQREAAEAARAEGRREATDQYAATMLRAVIRAHNPELPDGELDELVEETNFAAFVTDDGVDEDKLLRRAERAAGTTTRRSGPDLGQGSRGGRPSKSGVQEGNDLYEKHYGKG